MKKSFVLACVIALLFLLIAVPVSAGETDRGDVPFCAAYLDGYGYDTFATEASYTFFVHKNEIYFKCKGTLHAFVTPPTEEVEFNGGRLYYYWETNAVDWWAGFWDGIYGPATGSTEDVKISIYPDGTWTLKAKAVLP